MKTSAGILLYRKNGTQLQVFLVHPGGPLWKTKDIGAWSIPKGEFTAGEDPLTVAQREFREETGQQVHGDFVELSPVKQKGGKMVYAWAVEGNADAANITCNTFQLEWPYKSGKHITVPEVDKAAWCSLEQAKLKINAAQVAFLEELEGMVQ